MNGRQSAPQPSSRWLALEIPLSADSALRRAQQVAIGIDCLASELRTACFRAYLQETVHSMSRLAPDVLELMGFDIERALNCLRPVRGWLLDHEASPPLSRRQTPRSIRSIHGGWSTNPGLWRREPSDVKGDALLCEGALEDYLVIGIFGPSLELDFRSGGLHLTTRAGMAHLTLAGALPDILAGSCQGRPLQDVVDHPLLRGRGFVVDEVERRSTSSTIIFNAGQLDLRMPWDREAKTRAR